MAFFPENKPSLDTFNSVKVIFAQNPHLIKLKKDTVYSSQPSLPCSFIKINDNIYAIGKGIQAHVGKGKFAHVKEVIDIDGNHYVVKIQDENNVLTMEEEIACESGLFIGSAKNINYKGSSKKYYLMPYLGDDLFTYLQKDNFSVIEKIIVTIKILECVNEFHKKYVHRDLKPENITMEYQFNEADNESAGLQIHLIDFGFSKKINAINYPSNGGGTALYLPITNVNDIHNRKKLMENINQLGSIGNDIFALKRILFLNPTLDKNHIDPEKSSVLGQSLYNKLPSRLKNILDTTTIEKNRLKATFRNEDSALYLAACFVWYANNIDDSDMETEFNQFEEKIRNNPEKQEELLLEFNSKLSIFIAEYHQLIRKIDSNDLYSVQTALSKHPALLNYAMFDEKTPFQYFLNTLSYCNLIYSNSKKDLKSPAKSLSITIDSFKNIIETRKEMLNLFLFHFSLHPFPLNKLDAKALLLTLLMLSFHEENHEIVQKVINNTKLELHSLSISKKDKLIGYCLNFLSEEQKPKMQQYIREHTTNEGNFSIILEDLPTNLKKNLEINKSLFGFFHDKKIMDIENKQQNLFKWPLSQ